MGNRKPTVHEIRSPRLAATFARTYHAGVDEWHRTDILDRDELLLAAELLNEANRWILQREAK